MSPIVTSMPACLVLGAQPLGHRGRELDPGHRHTSSRQRQCDPAGADGELQRGAVPGELGQQVDRRAVHAGVEHRGRALVVAGGDVLTEVVLGHRRKIA
jgi:hypothetical protein